MHFLILKFEKVIIISIKFSFWKYSFKISFSFKNYLQNYIKLNNLIENEYYFYSSLNKS